MGDDATDKGDKIPTWGTLNLLYVTESVLRELYDDFLMLSQKRYFIEQDTLLRIEFYFLLLWTGTQQKYTIH